MESDTIQDIFSKRKNIKFKLIIQGCAIGIITGLVIVLNRVLIDKFFHFFKDIYKSSSDSLFKIIMVLAFVTMLGLLTGRMVRKESMISGSGIPQVKGVVLNKLKMNWLRILIYKFLGGVIGLSVGLSLGREGPSVQIGACIGEGVNEKCGKKIATKKEFLITAGASAGLSAAFNSPLSGIMFALEEVHRSFSPLVLLPAMVAALMADFVSKRFLGLSPTLNFYNMKVLPLSYYWALIILGIIVALSGIIFSKGVFIFQNIYAKFKRVPVEIKVAVPFFITAIVGISAPQYIGGGHEMIMSLAKENPSITILLLMFCAKLLLLLICFASGVPGGIFLPMLLLGAIVGDIVGIILCSILGIPSSFIINFITLGMAGYFAAVVKAPITGIVLIMEMTGSFDHLLALAIVVTVAYVTSEALNNEPIYEVLLEKLLKKAGFKEYEDDTKKTLLEFPVEVGSIADDKYIAAIDWPKECLLVAIKRGDKEIIPRGRVKLVGGDYLVVLVNIKKASKMIELINDITLVV